MNKNIELNILFVCLGNICRSPLAEGVMKDLIDKHGLDKKIKIDSAGISGYHQGELPNPRMQSHAKKRGYNLTSRSRQVKVEDFDKFNYIIGMDDNNIDALNILAPSPYEQKKIHRMTDFCQNILVDHVPDPYYGGASGFESVLDIVEDACQGLLKYLINQNQVYNSSL